MGIKLKTNNGNLEFTTHGGKVIRGIDGGYYTPVIDAEGNLSWIASLTDMEDIAAVNVMGPEGKQGIQGPKGDTGAAFTYDMFTVEQLEALRGPQGEQGIQGIQGIPGLNGKDGIDGTNGTNGIDGKDGAPGKDGVDGKDGESGVYVGTEEPTDDEMLIWINPEGTESEDTFVTKSYVDEAISAAIGEIENGSYQ